MTPQEIFDTALTKVLEQGKACIDINYECYYAHPDDPNMHCAVGHLMNEAELKEYGSFMGNINNLLDEDKTKKVLRPLFRENKALLSSIQDAHDDASADEDFRGHFKSNMKGIAMSWGLEYKDE